MRSAVLIVLVLWPNASFAYRTARDLPELDTTDVVRWRDSLVRISINADGAPAVSYSAVEDAVLRGIRQWTTPACSSFDVRFDGVVARAMSGDSRNSVEWIRERWTELGFTDELVGTTDLTFERGADGVWEIVEADILLNALNYDWHPWSGDTDGTRRAIDAVLAHEGGHLAGLAHSCGEAFAPDCASDPSLLATTMYPLYAGPDQLSLEPDDVDGICFLYPSGECDCAATEACVDGACQPRCGGAVCPDGWECDGSSCVEATTSCSSDADCSGRRCSDGVCVARAIGEMCSSDADCSSELCRSGTCTGACDDGCPAGSTCTGGFCAADGLEFGDECSGGDQCASNLCLLAESDGYCTRTCSASNACPPQFACDEVEERSVCVARAQDGCSAGGASSGALFFLALVLWRRR